ncbi:sigma 54-interacting transcriptional regulator [Edaphobacter albus]|uniref:sigma 54-interacting transcriptional regulator n=1 Tax=Edaphobacter sp. 4G125 TaxID=2763071 RepID=UPI001644919E|nr:sigma 54-interacting transcriptional regulator [Edaphobacter sp. 4G125]QNI38246.1 sigma-54-dependent Fis family transcriptional regulator [Edaphobacter sp. 4G125]
MSLSALTRVSDNPHDNAPTLIGDSASTQRVRLQIERIGPHFRTVLVRGETGTGKERVARALHARSSRADEQFLLCHASVLAEDPSLLRSMLEKAIQGTLFIAGIEEIPIEAQKGFLRILDQRTGTKLIVSSTQDLRGMAAAGLFRHDLYHRLAIEIPLEPLRRRMEDLPSLAKHFLEKFSIQYERQIEEIAPEAWERLLTHSWPGNVRELENVIHNGVLQCSGTTLNPEDLSLSPSASTAVQSSDLRKAGSTLKLQDVIDQHVLRVLSDCSGNKVRAAEILGISRSTLYRMLEGSSEQRLQPQN